MYLETFPALSICYVPTGMYKASLKFLFISEQAIFIGFFFLFGLILNEKKRIQPPAIKGQNK